MSMIFFRLRCQNASPAAQALVNETFFYQENENQQPTAKALLIDMEPKVVNKCLHSNQNGFRFSPQLSFTKQEGSGNNWAYGYNVHGPKTENDILNRVNTLLEKIDYLEGFFMMSSLAGGTGSGVGSFIQETLSMNYPELILLNICVMPHLTGEVILQSLNSSLTIAHLYKYSEGIIMLSNDEAAESCNHLLHNNRPSLDQINELMSASLASFFFPSIGNNQQIFSTMQNGIKYFDDIVCSLLLDTRFKLLQLQHIPQMPAQSKAFSSDTWVSLEKRISQMIMTGTREYNINWNTKAMRKCKGALMVARGIDSNKTDFPVVDQYGYKLIRDNHHFNGNEKSISCLHNSQTIASQLDVLAMRATQMYKENAYIYQYEKFGIEKQNFQESIAIFESIISNYNSL